MRRLLRLLGLISGTMLALALACGDESPILVLRLDAGAIDGAVSLPSDGGDTDVMVGARDARSADDATLVDAANDADLTIERDAGERIDANGCTTCDCDRDGYDRPNCGAGGGEDCDDSDTRYRPNQRFIEQPPEQGRTGDWNCKYGIEKRYPWNVSCSLLSLADCDGSEGFSGDPACGEEGEFVTCKKVLGLLLCQTGSSEPRIQACR